MRGSWKGTALAVPLKLERNRALVPEGGSQFRETISQQIVEPKILDSPCRRKRDHGKESYRLCEAADRRRQGDSGASGRPGAGPGADQHHGVLQAVQRQNEPKGDGGAD